MGLCGMAGPLEQRPGASLPLEMWAISFGLCCCSLDDAVLLSCQAGRQLAETITV